MKTKVQRIKEQIQNAKELQWNASQQRNASGVFTARRELESLWAQLDQARRNGAVE
jgi:hypothetical protein